MTAAFLTAFALAAGFLAAGCLAPSGLDRDAAGEAAWQPGPRTPKPPFDFTKAIEARHNHADPAGHTNSYGFRLVAFDPLISASEPTTLPGAHNEVAVANGWAFVASFGPHRGMAIVDVRDPAKPRHVSDFLPSAPLDPGRFGTGTHWDVSVLPDASLVVLSAQALANSPTSDDGSEERGGGVWLVNTEDKARPFAESFTPVVDPDALVPVGVHNANPFEARGSWYVAATTANGATHILKVEGEAPERTLRHVSIVKGVHDTTVQVHPLTGDLILYGAQGGVVLTNVTDPENPEIMGVLPNGPQVSAYHQVVPNNVLIEGRHYTMTATESTEGNPTPFSILDTTDPYDPQPVSQWKMPTPVSGTACYQFSGHNADVEDGRLIIGHYHAGVWVVDFSHPEHAKEPFAIGFYQPHEPALNVPRTPNCADTPMVWNAVLAEDGYVYASDVNSGLYVLEFTGPPSPYKDDPNKWSTNLR